MASRRCFGILPTNMHAEPPFPPRALRLTSSEEFRLIELADQIVSETLAASEDFEIAHHHVNEHKWKLVKEKESMQVYRARRRQLCNQRTESFYPERPQLYSDNEDAMRDFFLDEWIERSGTMIDDTDSSSQASESPSSSSSSSDQERNRGRTIMEVSKHPQVPLVFGTGTVEGSIEDMALGALATTDRMCQLRDEARKDTGIKHSKILATIHKPTQEDPFRYLGVKWSCRAPLHPLIRQRDFLDIESTGITKDAKGQRRFYYLIHSIELPQVPEFRTHNIVRGRLSLCFIGKPVVGKQADLQNSLKTTSVYCLGFLDERGMAAPQLTAGILGKAISSACKVSDMSHSRKLAWLLGGKHQQKQAANSSKSSIECACCSKGFASITNPFGSRAQCGLCRQEICKQCVVKKNVAASAMTSFCIHCIVRAKQLDARQVALCMVT